MRLRQKWSSYVYTTIIRTGCQLVVLFPSDLVLVLVVFLVVVLTAARDTNSSYIYQYLASKINIITIMVVPGY